jgi:hypothetical protein
MKVIDVSCSQANTDNFLEDLHLTTDGTFCIAFLNFASLYNLIFKNI